MTHGHGHVWLALVVWLMAPAQSSMGQGCITCHDGPQVDLEKSAHPSLSCTDCHNGNEQGGTPEEAHSRELKFIGRPAPALVGAMCGDCHKKERDAHEKSPHFRALQRGDPGSATCVSCHTTAEKPTGHAIAGVGDEGSPTHFAHVAAACARCHSDPRAMARSGLRVDQFVLYEKSEHGHNILVEKSGSAATCVDCHLAHEAPSARDPLSGTHPKNQSKTCGSCHGDEKLMKEHGRSHLVVDRFNNSPHARQLDLGAPSCAGCHGAHHAHTPAPETLRESCARCHDGPARELAAGPHGAAEWVDEAAGTSTLVHCAHCHDAHGAERPGRPFGDSVCARCHAAGSHEIAEGNRLADISSKLQLRLSNLHQQFSKAQSRGHDLGSCADALGALDGMWHEHGALVHGVSVAKCERHLEAFTKQADALGKRLDPLTPGSRPLGWLPWMWAFLFAGVVLMWMKARSLRNQDRANS